MLKLYNPQLVFFMETKLDDKRMEIVRKCSFVSGFIIEANGSRGWLCLAWKLRVNITLRSFSKNHIDAIVKEDGKKGE